MPLQNIHLGHFLIDNIIDIPAAVAAFYNETVIGNRFRCVLCRKSRINIRILLDNLNMIRQAFIFIKQIFDYIVFRIRLHDPINCHILFQRIDHCLGIACN